MPGAFHGINMASQALRTFQRGLDVTGHNIANVNTVGYSRQTMDLVTMSPTELYDTRHLQLGNGVSIGSINRIRDAFLEARRLSAGSDLSKQQTMLTELSGAENAMMEPSDYGISAALGKLFDAWSGLAASPGDVGAQAKVQAAGATLTDRMRSVYGQLTRQSAELTSQIRTSISDVQAKLNEIADLNGEIKQARHDDTVPNDLLDRRDMLVRELGAQIDVRAFASDDGSIQVYSGQLTLVDSSGAKTFPTTFDSATSSVTDGVRTYPITKGRLGGLLSSQNSVNGYLTRLDSLANNLRTEVNALHQTGTNSLGNTGVSFFAGTGASDFALDAAILADSAAIATGTSGNAGDGALAQALADLRTTSIGAFGGGQTFEDYFESLVSRIGTDVTAAKNSADTHDAIAAQIDQQIQSISGVSIDDEMTNMMRYQRSYQAAAKTLTVMDQVTEDLIGMLRR